MATMSKHSVSHPGTLPGTPSIANEEGRHRTDLGQVWELPPITCPMSGVGRAFDPFDHDGMYKVLEAAREREPVFYCAELGCWVVTRYDDVLGILRDPERFSAQNANTPITPVPQEALDILDAGNYALEGIQVNCDPPRHSRIRKVVGQVMSMKHYPRLEEDIRRLVLGSLEGLSGKGRVDLMAEFTYELPAKVIFLILGLPEKDARQVKQWSANRMSLTFSRPTYEEQVQSARNMTEFWNYCVALVADRMTKPQNDFSSELLRLRGGDDSVLTINEINSATFSLLFAGHETTTSQLTNALDALLSEQENWEAICADPSLIPNAVEEALRMYGAVVGWRRRAKCDVEISGTKIPAGSHILMSFASANRDERQFEEPHRFDLRRRTARRQLTFGTGIHTCLGAPLARLEMKIMLDELSRLYPNLRRVAECPMTFAEAFALRAPRSLWVDLDHRRIG